MYEMLTKNGHNFYDMASMLQKAIRRCDFERAGYAANELASKYRKYLWKRLLVISAEDCYGIMTQEIVALKIADDMSDKKDNIFISKAIVLLCNAKKNRDACYFACNLMRSNTVIPVEEIDEQEIEKCKLLDDIIPDWVYDVHTLKGKIRGKTINDMIIEEQQALQPKQIGFFDNASWEKYLKER